MDALSHWKVFNLQRQTNDDVKQTNDDGKQTNDDDNQTNDDAK